MAKDKDSAALKDSKKRKREGDKSPSPLAEPSSAKVTKKDKSEKKEKKEKKDKSEKKEKKDKKKKKEKSQDADTSMADVEAEEEDVQMVVDVVGEPVAKDGEEPSGALVPFAKPLAEGKLAKKVLKTTKKAAKTKALKRGVKEVVKAVRKSPNYANAGKPDAKTLPLLILAADISPPDVISHLPVLAEDHGIPYVFVTSRAELGAAGATKRPTSVVMITPDSAGRKRAGKKDKKGGDDAEKDKGLEKIKEEEEDFRSSYKDLVKEVMGVTRALTV